MDLQHDQAHKQTDKELAALERRIRKVYRDAQKDLDKKIADFNRRFKAKDKIHQKELKDGKITEDQYKRWLSGQVFQGKQWQSKRDQMTATLVNADKVAQQIINGQVYGVFANNANWQSYLLEHEAGLNFGFELYDASTVERLLRDNPKVLPKYRLDIPKDQRWNQSLITRQITQGIIQGERLDQIAKRLEKVTDHDRNLCLTRARTAMTGAQNAGRQESMTRATGMGIKVKKEWLATLDHHTRTSHAKLDGVSVPINKKFEGELGEIEYPGDPHAPAGEVYNCRCTMIADLVDYPETDANGVQRYDNIDGKPIKDMTYDQWKNSKTQKAPMVPRAQKDDLTSTERSALRSYSGYAYSGINSYLRGEIASTNDIKSIISEIDSAMKKRNLQNGTVLYRGTDYNELTGFIPGKRRDYFEEARHVEKLVGKQQTLKAFTSASKDGVFEAYKKGVEIKYVIDEDIHGIDMADISGQKVEREVLLDRNLIAEVEDVKFKADEDGFIEGIIKMVVKIRKRL